MGADDRRCVAVRPCGQRLAAAAAEGEYGVDGDFFVGSDAANLEFIRMDQLAA